MRTERREIVADVAALLDAHHRRLAELLEKRDRRQRYLPRLVSATELARILGVAPWTVYHHAADLGGCKVAGALRFDPREAIERSRLKEKSAPVPKRTQRPSRRQPLTPIR